jgi:hypothetical protein
MHGLEVARVPACRGHAWLRPDTGRPASDSSWQPGQWPGSLALRGQTATAAVALRGCLGMAAVLGRVGLWRRLGVLLVLVLLASEIVVVGAGGGKSKNKNKSKKNKKKSGAKKKGAKKQHRGSGELPERASGFAEADHLAYFEREIERALLSGLDGTSGHANAALPKPISIVPQEALMAALLQAKMGITGSSLIDAIGDTMPAPAGGSSGSDTERSIHPELMVLGDSGWQPVHIGLVGNWTRHGFRCHGHAGEYPQKPNDPVAGRDVINATLAECQRTCQELRLCHYYSHRAADASDTGSGDVTRGNCELYSAEPTSALSKAVGGQPSAQDKSKGLSEKQTASRGDLQPEGEKSSLAQVDRCVVDLYGPRVLKSQRHFSGASIVVTSSP